MNRADLAERICQTVQEIGVLLDDGDRGAMRAAGLTPAHFNLLRQLEPDRRTGRTVTRLAELTLCTRGNVTRLVQRLVEAGLAEIRPDPRDQRLVRVYLTPLGAARLATAETERAELNAARFAEFGDPAAADLLDHLTGLVQHLRKHLAQR
ncbi:MAG: MarR family transcriptional regulator [Kribbellaceae bacterium]|nr:MarR family transcriptional regulator [Kribbellaceae bacterium]